MGSLEVMVPLAGLIDLDAERRRLSKAVERKQAELRRLQAKLENRKFINNAPPGGGGEGATKRAEAAARMAALTAQLGSLSQDSN